jgi:hypothetical protein
MKNEERELILFNIFPDTSFDNIVFSRPEEQGK